MDSNVPDRIPYEANSEVEEVDGTQPRKSKRTKAPRRILKAEREKLKREQLNDHFSKLADVLELCETNNGKASLLNEAIRLVKDMISQIQSLRRENAALLSESNYMIVERNELRDEKLALETQIKELEDKVAQSKPDLNMTPPECWQPQPHLAMRYADSHPPSVDSALGEAPMMGHLYVIPVGPDLQSFGKCDAVPTSQVSKPHARYPAPDDLWPQQLLEKQPNSS